jgi:signal transduction histidine kinase
MTRIHLLRFRQGLILAIVVLISACSLPKGPSAPLYAEMNKGQTPSAAWNSTDSLFVPEGNFNPGPSVHSWWVKTTIQNPEAVPTRLLLILNNPHINRLEVFLDGQEKPFLKTGDRLPFSERPFEDRDMVVPLDLDAGDSIEVLLFLEKSGETFSIETEILSERLLSDKRQGENLIIGIVAGWMFLVVLFAGFFWLDLKQSSALFYAGFIISNLLWLLSHWGLGYQYLWPESPEWVAKTRPLFNLFAVIFFQLVILKFFPPLQRSKWITQVMWVFIIILTGTSLGIITIPEDQVTSYTKLLVLNLTFVLTILSLFSILIFLIIQWISKVPLAGYYLAGIAFFIVFGVLILSDSHGYFITKTDSLLKFSSAFGMMGETAFITAAFTRRAAAYKLEKEKLAYEILQKEKEVAEQIIEVQEDERNRLGRDLHDSIGGMLASINIQAEQIFHQYPEAAVDKLKQLVSQSIREARSLSHNLTPPHLDEFGLEKVLQNHVTLLSEQYHLDINFYSQLKTPLSKAEEISLYRICNELLYNIVKHANATEAMLNLIEENGNLELIVEDNGKGIDPNKKSEGIGLRNIRERINYLKGELSIDSNSSGTTTLIKIPIHV